MVRDDLAGDTGRGGESGAIPSGSGRDLDCIRNGIAMLSKAFKA